ncbi:MAG TPA: nucleotide exchange factor GrpE [Gemmatimonadota bacterium]|nr:nucleotide exchange factor GrpE [Gemmatimonadota bacterium]
MTAKKKKEQATRPEDSREPADLADAGAEADLEEAAEPVVPTEAEVIDQLSDALQELEDRHLRLVAEFDNFRKRTQRERAQQAERAQAELAKGLLESLDDLSRVVELGSTDHDAAALLEGVQLVEAKLRRALEAFGLRIIDAAGQPFNPEIHDALVTMPTDRPEEDDVVSQEITRGYMFKDALLRPTLVQVKKYQPDQAGGDAEGAEGES